MIEFCKYGLEEIKSFLPYFKKEEVHSCDYTLGIKYMWKKYFSSMYAIKDNTLTIKEVYDGAKYSFYYPIGENVDGMFNEIINYQLNNLTQNLEFCCVDDKHLDDLKVRFPHGEVYFNDDWSDYLYLNKNFQTFAGGSYSNKRHHVKQFQKLYPETVFRKCVGCDKNKLVDFMLKFEQTKEVTSQEAINEFNEAMELARHYDELGFDCFFLEHKGQIIAVSICEVINDCVYDHIEKALREYTSIYPYFVQQIANFYSGIEYFNREDDSGDPGLRYSKQDYHPTKMVHKNMYYVNNNLDLLLEIPLIEVDEHIKICKLKEEDKEQYFNLNIDEQLNKYWGYDYKKDLGNNELNANYFLNMVQEDFRKKEYFSFIIKKDNVLIGEIVLSEPTQDNGVEIGYRLIEAEQHKGIMTSCLSKVITYLKDSLKLKYLSAKCFLENKDSEKILEKLNFTYSNSDEVFNHYFLDLNN